MGHDSLKIDLSYSSSILEDFLRTMSTLQGEFGRRSLKAAPSPTAVGECSGSSSCV
ncbi:hypothetical protein [Streptomyces antarcticus]|uniref:hypothetical protein n=1 Tax=Streptomyces antarcticus TaxID=2996458 RepID=UPI0022702494|nr:MULTISPECIES: hypothetical protein [unclassified Streptomyces]MCY0940777.1 hypothetical protein [Streptomyces sp. H34-AA3]MCZ4082977.1 hypothetical protein [Streptomyces sp. H34-S5]